jgi:hypothetical protein
MLIVTQLTNHDYETIKNSFISICLKYKEARLRWLIPVLLAEIVVQGQLPQTVWDTPSHQKRPCLKNNQG